MNKHGEGQKGDVNADGRLMNTIIYGAISS